MQVDVYRCEGDSVALHNLVYSGVGYCGSRFNAQIWLGCTWCVAEVCGAKFKIDLFMEVLLNFLSLSQSSHSPPPRTHILTNKQLLGIQHIGA